MNEKRTLQNTTADALLFHLGYDQPRPVMRTVIATALDMLTPEAKADVVQYLRHEGAPTCPRGSNFHNWQDGRCDKCGAPQGSEEET